MIDYEYDFPMRLALFPGMSCMYYCGFCGRNQNAKYRGSVMKEGNQRFKDIISNMPKHSTLSISGGLEPLTNSGLSDIISHAKSEGVRVPLITKTYVDIKIFTKKSWHLGFRFIENIIVWCGRGINIFRNKT